MLIYVIYDAIRRITEYSFKFNLELLKLQVPYLQILSKNVTLYCKNALNLELFLLKIALETGLGFKLL